MNKPRALFMGIVALGATVFFVWLTTSRLIKSEAARSKVDIVVTSGQKLAGQVAFVVQPQKAVDRVSGVDLIVDVENGTLSGWSNCTSLDTSATYPFTELINRNGKKARYSCVVIKDSTQLPPNVTLHGTVACDGAGPARVSVSKDTMVSGPVEGTTYELGDIGSTQVSCTGGTGGGGDTDGPRNEQLSATFTPETCTGPVGTTCSYDLRVESRTQKAERISGLYVKLAFDGDVMDLADIKDMMSTPAGQQVQGTYTLLAQAAPTAVPRPDANTTLAPTPTGAPTPALTATPTSTPSGTLTPAPTSPAPTTPAPTTPTPSPVIPGPQSNCTIQRSVITDSEAELLYTCSTTKTSLPTGTLHRFTFKSKAPGKGNITIKNIQVVGPDATGPYTVYKGKASYAIGKPGKGNVEIDLKLRLQCVVKKPKRNIPVKVRIGLGDGGLPKTQYETVDMTFNENGQLVGKVFFDVQDFNKKHKLQVKHMMGMQKKVCDAFPKEDYPGAYSCDKGQILLKEGKNALDFTNIIMMTGDLPPDGQDGISNSKDLALVRNLIGKRDAESAALADVNFDGVVNGVDHSCMLAFVRWDEL